MDPQCTRNLRARPRRAGWYPGALKQTARLLFERYTGDTPPTGVSAAVRDVVNLPDGNTRESLERNSMDEKERTRTLTLTLGQIEKQFGKGSILRLGAKEAIVPVSAISTGSISVDYALGVGGFPRGRICEIFGPESSGKTTIALQVVAQAQKNGGMAAFIDVEHALDPVYAKQLGVDVDNLLVSQPDYAEQALEITSALITSGSIDVLVVDSVAALVPKSELDGEMGDSHMGVQARLMSQAMRKLTGIVSKSNTCLIFINQIREKIGVMFGNPETTTGGRALKFYSSVRVDIRRIAAIKDGDVVTGNRTKVKVVKNKVASPFREAEFDIIYGEGVSREGDLLDLGVAHNVVEKSGSWFSYKGERIGQGRENARQFMKDNPDIMTRIDGEVRRTLGLIKTAEPDTTAPPPPTPIDTVKPASAGRGR
jgi:recombination protein RecA